MIEETTTPEALPEAPAEKPAPKKAPAKPLHVLCKVTKNRLAVAGGLVAKGAAIKLEKGVAEFHESRNEIEILGTA
jgi:hypothetical protein